jgi:hypothetical protein
VNSTVIGGEQSGWKSAVTTIVNSALPFCTGKVHGEQDELAHVLSFLERNRFLA